MKLVSSQTWRLCSRCQQTRGGEERRARVTGDAKEWGVNGPLRGEGGEFPIQGQQQRGAEREEEKEATANRIEGKEIKKEREANNCLTSGEGITWQQTQRERESPR